MEYFLKEINPQADKPILICLNSNEVTVGRHSIVSLTRFNRVSRYHALFSKRNGSWFVKDMGSLNKLYVNFKEVHSEWGPLEIGDIIGLGTPSCSEDGGFVCVFALKTRVKMENVDENESKNPASSTSQQYPLQNSTSLQGLKNKSEIKQEITSPDLKKEIIKVDDNDCSLEHNTLSSLPESVNGVVTYLNGHNCKNEDSIALKPNKISEFKQSVKINEDGHYSQKFANSNEFPSNINIRVDGTEPLVKGEVNSLNALNTKHSSNKHNNSELSVKNYLINVTNKCSSGSKGNNSKFHNSVCQSSVTQNTMRQKHKYLFLRRHMKNCCVRLIKCDSELFQWPHDVKRQNFHKLFKSMKSSENIYNQKASETIQTTTENKNLSNLRETFNKRSNVSKDAKENESKNLALQLRVKKNKIFSSDSEVSEDESKKATIKKNKGKSNNLKSKNSNLKKNITKIDKTKMANHKSHFRNDSLKATEVPLARKKEFISKKRKHFENSENSSASEFEDKILYPSKLVQREETTLEVKPSPHILPNENISSKTNASLIKNPLIQNKPKNNELSGCSEINKFNKRKTVGRTLLTDPKPMEPRPKKMRGKEEGFQERCSGSTIKIEHAKPRELDQKLSYAKKVKNGSCSMSSTKSANSSSSKKNSSESHFENKQNAAKPSVSSDTHFENRSLKQNTSASSDAHKNIKNVTKDKTKSSVPRRPSSYGSRMGFLIDMESKENKEDKSTPHKSKTKIPDKNAKKPEPVKTVSVEKPKLQKKSSETQSISRTPNCKPVKIVPGNMHANTKELKKSDEKEVIKNVIPVAESSNSQSELKRINPLLKSNQNPLTKQTFNKTNQLGNNKRVAVVSPVGISTFNSNYKAQQSNFLQPYVEANSLVNESNLPPNRVSVQQPFTNHENSATISSSVKANPTTTESDSIKTTDSTPLISINKLNSHSAIEDLIQWNPNWLEEQSKNKKPPPMISKGGAPLPLKFSSHDSYVKSFYPMIILEIWESLFMESKPLWSENKDWNIFFYIITGIKIQNDFIELYCESVVNEDLSFRPHEGEVILLDIKGEEEGLKRCIFGYIDQHKVEELNFKDESLNIWQKMPNEWLQNAKLWTFNVHIKKTKRHFKTGTINLAHGILNIKKKLQLVDALLALKSSPLLKEILKPSKEIFLSCGLASKTTCTELIQIISDKIKHENPQSKTILINAPPGTGKTGVIIGIIEKLIFSNAAKNKVLMCAPSDISVDEIGSRLIELNDRCSWKRNSIKFLRFGQLEKINPKLHGYTLGRKVQKMFKEQIKKEVMERDKELEALESKINEVLFKANLKNSRYRKINNETLKKLMDQLKSLKEKNPLSSLDSVSQITYENIALKESNVILSTLDDSMNPLMNKFLKSGQCIYCIVDEASQCTEPEILQCLNSEVSRLILVGDIQQLPPSVSSKYAIKWGFKRSMLERFYKLFKKQYFSVPAFTLTEQHRMQSQICHFPSKYFYSQQLESTVNIDERFIYCPLKPVIIYDILTNTSGNTFQDTETNEALIIAYICSQLLQAVPNASIGVIVTNENLTSLYRNPLSGNDALRNVEVNIVEKYQGKEKDIIIISCINPTSEDEAFLACKKKMNVAITRARQCLIICGHISSLTKHPHWTALMDDAKNRKNVISVSSLSQIPVLFMKTVCRMV
ncbi:helicase sen1 [Caerostris extrusa]|uniref:Helicase sen1 n=1 Tax=Caerostris extrusa TaxID=172846 RepID=A0AAV4QSA3_CAEEX|nr:helicase sen1 [Caerostris extrusa]